MSDFRICIPSSSRPAWQKTIQNLDKNLWPHVIVVVPPEQYYAYREAVPKAVEVLGIRCVGISQKRQYILHLNTRDKVIIMDDDLSFYKRTHQGGFTSTIPEDTTAMVLDILAILDSYPYMGLVDKYFSQTRPRGIVECTRFNQVMAINRDKLPNPWPLFRPMVHEEHDFHLQFLTRGLKTAVTAEWSKTDRYNAPGGCSEWRDDKVMIDAGKMMLEFWPGIVSINEKKKPYGAHLRYNWRRACQAGGL